MAVDLTEETKEALKDQASLEDPKKEDGTDYGEPQDTPEPESKPDDTGDQTPIDLGEPDKSKFDTADFEAALEKDGDISEEAINAAKEKFDPDLVDAQISRLKAEHKLKQYDKYAEAEKEQAKKVESMNKYIYETVGGEDKFKDIAKTLRSSLGEEARERINAKLLSGNKTLVSEGIEVAVSEYKKLKGIGGNRMEGDANAPSEKAMKITKEEYRQIMKTEKYKTDPMYRSKIDDARLKTRQEDQAKYGPGTYYAYNQNGRYEL